MYPWWRFTIYLRCTVGWWIQSFSKKLHKVRDITVRIGYVVLVEFRSNRVSFFSVLFEIQCIWDGSDTLMIASVLSIQFQKYSNTEIQMNQPNQSMAAARRRADSKISSGRRTKMCTRDIWIWVSLGFKFLSLISKDAHVKQVCEMHRKRSDACLCYGICIRYKLLTKIK